MTVEFYCKIENNIFRQTVFVSAQIESYYFISFLHFLLPSPLLCVTSLTGHRFNLFLCIFHSGESLERSTVWFLHCRLQSSSKTSQNSDRCQLTTMPKPLTTLNLHSFLQLMESPLVVSATKAASTNANLSWSVFDFLIIDTERVACTFTIMHFLKCNFSSELQHFLKIWWLSLTFSQTDGRRWRPRLRPASTSSLSTDPSNLPVFSPRHGSHGPGHCGQSGLEAAWSGYYAAG